MKNFYAHNIDEVLDALGAKREGLSSQDVKKRIAKYGSNKLPEGKPPSLWLIFFHQFASPLIYILLFAGIVTVFMQEYPGAVFIFIVLLVNAVIGTVQEHAATNAAEALKKMVTTHTKVLRDGEKQMIDAVDIVPGDIVFLESGDKVPADIRLIESRELNVDESLLTGESQAVEKDADEKLGAEATLSERVNMAFAGTVVTHGRAKGVVYGTGAKTLMGKIAKDILGKEEVKSPLIIRMEKFTVNIAIAVGVTILLISTALYFRGDSLENIFLIAVGLAVASIPEGLPVTVTIALAIGMQRMAKRNVIVRRLVAVEALGSCTLIASDKTGTLTQNEIRAEKAVLPSGKEINIKDDKNGKKK